MSDDKEPARSQENFNTYVAGEIRQIKTDLAANTSVTHEIADIIRAGRGFFRVLGFMAFWTKRILLWCVIVGTALTTLWGLVSKFFEHKTGG